MSYNRIFFSKRVLLQAGQIILVSMVSRLVCETRVQGPSTKCNIERDTTKNNFTIIQGSVTRITPHISGLLPVVLQFFVWKKCALA